MSTRSSAQSRRRLTPKQIRILSTIRDYQRAHGCSPTMQEIADQHGVTKVTVFEHVESLIGKGLLRRLPHKARSLELTSRAVVPDEPATRFTIAGYIAAGLPIEPAPEQDVLDVEDFFRSRHGTFVLKVRGDSMIDEQICDGDYVVCEQRSEARQGETVVALLSSGEATLKKYYKDRGKIRLQPANAAFDPILVSPQDVHIQGVVLGVLRAY